MCTLCVKDKTYAVCPGECVLYSTVSYCVVQCQISPCSSFAVLSLKLNTKIEVCIV